MPLNPNLATKFGGNLQYHVDDSNPHCLLDKMVDLGIAANKDDAFDKCFGAYRNSDEGGEHFEVLKSFLEDICKHND